MRQGDGSDMGGGRVEFAKGALRHVAVDKHKAPVRIELANGAVKHGLVFLRSDQRVIDLLCDTRPFFPVETRTGIIILNKNAVSMVVLMSRAEIEAEADLFPEIDWKQMSAKS